MKKSIVLLITLFFIASLLILILKNLHDMDHFVEQKYLITHNTQLMVSIKNTQKEFSRLLKQSSNKEQTSKRKNFINTPVDIKIKELQINSILTKYTKKDINNLQDKNSTEIEELFLNNNLYGYSEFQNIYFDYFYLNKTKIKNSKQLDVIIDNFTKDKNNKNLNTLNSLLGFISNKENLYELNIVSQYLNSKATAYYILQSDGKVQYFEISFN